MGWQSEWMLRSCSSSFWAFSIYKHQISTWYEYLQLIVICNIEVAVLCCKKHPWRQQATSRKTIPIAALLSNLQIIITSIKFLHEKYKWQCLCIAKHQCCVVKQPWQQQATSRKSLLPLLVALYFLFYKLSLQTSNFYMKHIVYSCYWMSSAVLWSTLDSSKQHQSNNPPSPPFKHWNFPLFI